MVVYLSQEEPVLELTRAVFGEDCSLVLHGRVEAYSRDGQALVGYAFITFELGEQFKYPFTHPVLFSDLPLDESLCEGVQVTLEGRYLVRRNRGPWDEQPRGGYRNAFVHR